MSEPITGSVRGVYISTTPGNIESEARQEVLLTLEGIEGDRHAGLTMLAGGRTRHFEKGMEIRNTRQVSIVSENEMGDIAESIDVPEVRPEWVGANLCIDGVADLTALPAGTRLFFAQGPSLVIDEENMPCTGPGDVLQANYPERAGLASIFPKMAIGKRGLVGWVEYGGVIEPGDEVVVQLPK